MATRLDLQRRFEDILESKNVYYQPPESIKLKYPCIIYSLSDIYARNADDMHYSMQKAYTVTVISRDPDNTIAESILQFPRTRFDRRYIADNLYHDILTLYYKV